MDKTRISLPTVYTAEEIDGLPAAPLGTLDGVIHRVLWRSDTSIAGLLTVEAGRRLGMHAHRINHHHIWVLEGRATIVGDELGAGSYVHIPSGIEHDLDATNTNGCTVFYLYIRHAE